MKNLIINLYFKTNISDGKDPGLVQFVMQGNSVEEVTNDLLTTTGKYPIDIDGGYKIINVDNVCWIDVIDPEMFSKEEEYEELTLDTNED